MSVEMDYEEEEEGRGAYQVTKLVNLIIKILV